MGESVTAADELRKAFERREMEVERRINLLRALLLTPFALIDTCVAAVSGKLGEVVALFLPVLLIWGAVLFAVHRILADGKYHPRIKYLTITLDALILCAAAVGLQDSGLYAEMISGEVLAASFIATAVLLNGLGALRLGRAAIVYSGVAIGLASFGLCQYLSGSLLLAVSALLIIGLSTTLNLLYSAGLLGMFVHLRRREAMMRFLPRPVVESIDRGEISVELGGERRAVAFLMSDIRGFTAISERVPAEEVVAFLNRYLEQMVGIVMEHDGTIVDIIGDAVFAVFGAPVRSDTASRNAVDCALAMQLAMSPVNQEREPGFPEVEIGIGLHRGEVVVGNIGSSSWMKYGAVGSHVNLTSRIESATVGGQILVSDALLREDGLAEYLVLGDRISLAAKGVGTPVILHDLRGVTGESASGAGAVALAQRDDEIEPLCDELAVELTLLEGKKVTGSSFAGHIVGLARRGAAIRTAQPLALLANLQVRLGTREAGTAVPEVSAKVRRSTAEPDVFYCRFTFVPEEAETMLARLRADGL